MPEKKKLTYEELQSYSSKLFEQAQQLFNENKQLKETIKNISDQHNIAEINLALRALDHKDLFSTEFVSKLVTKLEEMLTPAETPEPENK